MFFFKYKYILYILYGIFLISFTDIFIRTCKPIYTLQRIHTVYTNCVLLENIYNLDNLALFPTFDLQNGISHGFFSKKYLYVSKKIIIVHHYLTTISFVL